MPISPTSNQYNYSEALSKRYNNFIQASSIDSIGGKHAFSAVDAYIEKKSNQKKSQNKQKMNNLTYISGVLASAGQALSGGLIIGSAILDWKIKKGKKLSPANFESLKKISERAHNWGMKILGASYLVSLPSCFGASAESKQPSMFTGTLLWGAAAPFMMKKQFKDSARLLATIILGTGFVYSGLANKIKIDNGVNKGEKARKFEFGDINKDNFAEKSAEFLKFVAEDQLNVPKAIPSSISQGVDYITGKRQKPPDFWTTKPTANNAKLTSAFLYAGSLLMMAFGKKKKSIDIIANTLIGTGLMFESFSMFTLGNAKKGIDKWLILAGVPLRTIGDFGQTNKALLGMRTLGGASFEYYFATLNEKEEKAKSKETKKA